MLVPLAAFALAATAANAIVDAHAGAGTQAERPLLVAHGDGSWTITRAVHEDPVMLEIAAEALLLADVEDLRFSGEAGEREALREIEMEDQFERAFEEAVDKAGEFETPQ